MPLTTIPIISQQLAKMLALGLQISDQALLMLHVSLCLASTVPSDAQVLQSGEACVSALKCISVYNSAYACVCVCESRACFSITLSA